MHRATAKDERTRTDTLSTRGFADLMSSRDWAALPQVVQRRFTRSLKARECMVFHGVVRRTEHHWLGGVLAQLARLIGSPLPLERQRNCASVVTVTQDHRGQIWSRQYRKSGQFPQVIHSVKRFTGPTGLMEQVAMGVCMSLRLSVNEDTLTFRSDRFYLRFLDGTLGYLLPLPKWLSVFQITVKHIHLESKRFRFELTLSHRLLGSLITQIADYSEVESD